MELDKAQKIKLGVAGVALLVTAILLAGYFGLFGGGTAEPNFDEDEMTSEEIQELEEEQQRQLEEWQNLPPEQKGGA